MKKSIKCTLCGVRILKSKFSAHFLAVHDPNYTILDFRKSLIRSNSQPCDRCGNQSESLWKFEENRRNVVYLCEQCVAHLRQEAPKKERDILDSGKIFVNSFESNPRKH